MKKQNPGSILSYFSKKGHVEHEDTSISEDSDCDSDPDIVIPPVETEEAERGTELHKKIVNRL